MEQGKVCDPNRAAGKETRSPWVHTGRAGRGIPPQELLLSLGNGRMPCAMAAQRDDRMVGSP